MIRIDIKLPSLNEYINICRANRYKASAYKKQLESDIAMFITSDIKYTEPVKITFVWHESNKKRDIDNVAFAKKFILDALVKKGVLINDNYKYVKGFTDLFMYDTKQTYVEVLIEVV